MGRGVGGRWFGLPRFPCARFGRSRFAYRRIGRRRSARPRLRYRHRPARPRSPRLRPAHHGSRPMKAVPRAAWAAVARRRVQTVVTAVVALLATATSVLGLGLLVASLAPFDHAF